MQAPLGGPAGARNSSTIPSKKGRPIGRPFAFSVKSKSGWPFNSLAGNFGWFMPFPLAHPAAVLPLRRYCPRHLNFPALVIGSLSPDLGYAFGVPRVGWLSHRFWVGSLGFCLPAGLLILWVFYFLRPRVEGILTARLNGSKDAPLEICRRPIGPPFPIVVSLLIGAWTHILLDSITHGNGWLVEHLAFLRSSLPWVENRRIGVYAVLYAGCTFVGVTWLALYYLRWLESCLGAPGLTRPGTKWGWALLLASGTLLIAEASRRPNQVMGIFPAGIITVLLVVGFVVVTGRRVAVSGQYAASLGPNAKLPPENTRTGAPIRSSTRAPTYTLNVTLPPAELLAEALGTFPDASQVRPWRQ